MRESSTIHRRIVSRIHNVPSDFSIFLSKWFQTSVKTDTGSIPFDIHSRSSSFDYLRANSSLLTRVYRLSLSSFERQSFLVAKLDDFIFLQYTHIILLLGSKSTSSRRSHWNLHSSCVKSIRNKQQTVTRAELETTTTNKIVIRTDADRLDDWTQGDWTDVAEEIKMVTLANAIKCVRCVISRRIDDDARVQRPPTAENSEHSYTLSFVLLRQLSRHGISSSSK